MNNKHRKIVATGLAINMVLLNIPYNVFANNNIIEDTVLNSDNISLNKYEDIKLKNNENNEYDSINKEGSVNEEETIDDDLSIDNIEEGVSHYMDNSTSNIINEDAYNFTEINEIDNSTNKVNGYQEIKKTSKCVPSVTNYADSFAGGDGTQENPYQISNARELSRLAYLVNEENLDTTNMYFELTNDIDLNTFDSDDDESNGNWIPIGYLTPYPDFTVVAFKGVFNGNNYTISNINIPKDANIVRSGLFGYCVDVTIKNVNLENINVYSENGNVGALVSSLESSGVFNNINIKDINAEGGFVGGLVGYTQNIESIIINDCSVILKEDNIFTGTNIGGLLGRAYGSTYISNCSLDINISAKSNAGGLIGSVFVTSNNRFSFVLNDIDIICNINASNGTVGGVVGYFSPNNSGIVDEISINNINFKGSLINPSPIFTPTNLGGIIGYCDVYDSEPINISNCNLNFIDLEAGYIGGIIGMSTSINDVNLNNINISVSGNFISNNTSGGFFGWVYSSSATFILKNCTFTSEKEIEMGMYFGGLAGYLGCRLIIDNLDISANVKGNTKDSFIVYCGGIASNYTYYKQPDKPNEIDIRNVNINMNINIVDAGKDTNYAGGYFSYLNCNETVNISNSCFSGDIKANSIGGYVATTYANSTINIDNCYFIGDLHSKEDNGGIVCDLLSDTGDLNINLKNTYMVSLLNSDTGNTSLISPIDKTRLNLNIKNAYYDSSILNIEDDNFIGLTTEQMQGYPTYDNMNFDFDNVWKANKNYYPTFEQLNTTPELSGQDIELILNQEYNLLDYVTVEDFEDKDLIPEIVTDLDITKIGDYTVTFTVTDPKGLSDELTLNIKVVMENPTINASDVEIYKGEEFNPIKDVTAIDVDGADITEHIKIVENTVNTQEPGEYKVIYEIESLYNKSIIQKEIKVTVKEKVVIDEEQETTPSQPDKEEKPVSPTPEGDKDNNKVESSTDNTINNKPQTGDNFIVYGMSLLMSTVGLFYINRKKQI